MRYYLDIKENKDGKHLLHSNDATANNFLIAIYYIDGIGY